MSEETKLFAFGGKKIGRKLLDSWAYILLALVLFLAVVSGYTNVDLGLLTAINIGVDYIVLLFFCYTAMYSLDAIAKRRGIEDPVYSAAEAKVRELRVRLKKADGEMLQRFCDDYRETELKCTRQQILLEAMISDAEFQTYLSKGSFPPKASLLQKVALRRAKHCKPIKLNRYMIGRPIAASQHRMSFETPEQKMQKHSFVLSTTTAITLLFPVSITISVILDPSFAMFVTGLLKVFVVMLAGAKAYHGRIRNMTETIPEYAVIQEEIVDQFEAWASQKSESELAEPADEGSDEVK